MKFLIALSCLLAVAICVEVGTVTLNKKMLSIQGNNHYDDPFYNTDDPMCSASRERPMEYKGLDDYFGCMPKAFDGNSCYQDAPPGTTAVPMPIFTDKTDPENPVIRCALVCFGLATGDCAIGAECVILPAKRFQTLKGVCLYRRS